MPSFDDSSEKSRGSKDEDLISASFVRDPKRDRILVYGQPKVGKTWASMTCSSKWPASLPTKTPTVLEDVLSIAADSNANEGLKSEGVTPYEFDIRELIRQGKVRNIRDALKKVADQAYKYVTERGITTVVVDTISMIDFELGKYWFAPENIPTNERGQPDRFGAFREVLNSHGSFWQDLDFLPARVIYLCHAKVNSEAVKSDKQLTDRDRAKLASGTLAGTDIDITPQLTGQASELYLKNVGMILPMKMYGEAGQKGCERKFLPYGGGGLTGGNRYHHILKQEEDAHLGNLLRKLEQNAAKYSHSTHVVEVPKA